MIPSLPELPAKPADPAAAMRRVAPTRDTHPADFSEFSQLLEGIPVAAGELEPGDSPKARLPEVLVQPAGHAKQAEDGTTLPQDGKELPTRDASAIVPANFGHALQPLESDSEDGPMMTTVRTLPAPEAEEFAARPPRRVSPVAATRENLPLQPAGPGTSVDAMIVTPSSASYDTTAPASGEPPLNRPRAAHPSEAQSSPPKPPHVEVSPSPDREGSSKRPVGGADAVSPKSEVSLRDPDLPAPSKQGERPAPVHDRPQPAPGHPVDARPTGQVSAAPDAPGRRASGDDVQRIQPVPREVASPPQPRGEAALPARPAGASVAARSYHERIPPEPVKPGAAPVRLEPSVPPPSAALAASRAIGPELAERGDLRPQQPRPRPLVQSGEGERTMPRRSSPIAADNLATAISQMAPVTQPMAPGTSPVLPDQQIVQRAIQPIEAAIERLADARDAAGRSQSELTVRHREFGAVNVRIEALAGDLKAVISARDPAFVPAIQTALAERGLVASGDASAPQQHRSAEQGASQSSQQSGSGNGPAGGTAGGGAHSDQRYGSSTGSGQASPQPYQGHKEGNDEEPATAGADPSRERGGRDPAGRGLFA